jgi:KDO2-lipid IV(A) lauroyltransferase
MPAVSDAPALYAPRYWPTWIGFGLLRLSALLPWRAMMAIGRGLGRVTLRLLPRRGRIAEINLRLCFPELDPEARSALVRRHFESLGMGMMDVMAAWWKPDAKFLPLVSIHGRENVERAFAGGKGIIFLTAHFTSIEAGGRFLCELGPILPMYRPNENPVIERVMTAQRVRHVERTIPRDDVRLMLRTLRENKGIWFAPDQNFGHKHSVFSPFFGIPAATNTSTSRFAAMTGARVVPFVVLRREGRPGYEMFIEPALEDFPSGNLQQDTDRINAILERWIRQAPAQYLWSHRRFKDRPPGEPELY